MTTRRRLLQGTAATAVLLAAPSFLRTAAADAPTLPPLPPGQRLQTPEFDALGPGRRYAAGVRPHRSGGVRLSLEAPVDTPKGRKFFIHNYGHSGAGITLSWGCASHVVSHVETAMNQLAAANIRPSVAVLGTGVIGLTTATELRRKWSRLPITVYAKSLDVRTTTSFIAGGQFEPSQIFREYESDAGKAVLADYLRRSAARITELQNSGRREDFGVALRRNYTFDDPQEGFDDFTPRDVVAAPRRMKLPFEKLNANGREYITWLMNPQILLPTLVRELKGGGVLFEARKFTSEQQIRNELAQTIIVNCTGFGAKELFGDPALKPRRGHLVILKNPAELKYFFSGGCTNDVISYMFARQNDIVIGGTVNRNENETRDFFDAADPNDKKICDRLFDNARLVFGGKPDDCVAPPTPA